MTADDTGSPRDQARRAALNIDFEIALSTLPATQQETIRDSMRRGESLTYDFFCRGWLSRDARAPRESSKSTNP